MGKGKRSFKIFVYGIISQIVTLLLGIIMPKLLIVNYGSEVNGLLSSLNQIFACISLLEAGIGFASLQSLYAPIAKNDQDRINEIMAATDHYYKRTGFFYGLTVLIISFAYPFIVKSGIPMYVVVGVILLHGASGVVNYLVQGKLVILLRADGRNYVTTNATMLVTVLTKVVQIILILSGFDILTVQLAYFLVRLLQMVCISVYVKRHYPWLNLKVKPDYGALKQSKNVIVHQVARLIFYNTDMLVLSVFCGLKEVSVYSLYNMVVTCVSDTIDTACSSVEFILGQKFNTDRKEFLKIHNTYETYYYCFSFALFTITLIMLPSFISIYSSGFTDASYMDKALPYLFITLNILAFSRNPCNQIIFFAEHFKQTQNRTIIECVINIIVSVALVNVIGIYGVLVGTIVALLYRTNDIIIYANKQILERSCWITYRRVFQNIGVMIAVVFVVNKLLPEIDNYLIWAGNAVWVTLLTFAIYLLVDSIFDKKAFMMIKNLISHYVYKKLHK